MSQFLFDRHEGGERVLLVQISLDDGKPPADLQEFEELVRSAGGEPVALVSGRRRAPTAKYFVGEGKLEEIRDAKLANDAELVVFNHPLTPSQAQH